MSVFFDVSAALDDNLNTMVGLPSVAWPNKKFVPTQGALYIRPTLLPADTVTATIGIGSDISSGLYQLDIFSPADDGKNEALLMADTVAELFKRDKELTYNGRTITIRSASHRSIGNTDGWYHLSVDVTYYAYTAKR